MKNYWFVVIVAMGLQGCSNSNSTSSKPDVPEVDNAATRYVDSLHSNLDRAQVAVDKANAAVHQLQKSVGEAQSQME